MTRFPINMTAKHILSLLHKTQCSMQYIRTMSDRSVHSQIQFIGLYARRPMKNHSSLILLSVLQQVHNFFRREFFHTVRSSAFSFNLQHLHHSLKSSSSCSRLLPPLPSLLSSPLPFLQ